MWLGRVITWSRRSFSFANFAFQLLSAVASWFCILSVHSASILSFTLFSVSFRMFSIANSWREACLSNLDWFSCFRSSIWNFHKIHFWLLDKCIKLNPFWLWHSPVDGKRLALLLVVTRCDSSVARFLSAFPCPFRSIFQPLLSLYLKKKGRVNCDNLLRSEKNWPSSWDVCVSFIACLHLLASSLTACCFSASIF